MDYLLPVDRLIISIIVGIFIGSLAFVLLIISSIIVNYITRIFPSKRKYPIFSINITLKCLFIGFYIIRIFTRSMFPELFNGKLSIYNTVSYILEPITLYLWTILFNKYVPKKH